MCNFMPLSTLISFAHIWKSHEAILISVKILENLEPKTQKENRKYLAS